MGIASFALGVGTFAIAVLWYAFASILSGKMKVEFSSSFYSVYIIFLFFVAPVAHLVGEILGIIGLFMKNRRKVFPLLGVFVNLPFLLFWLAAYSLLYEWHRQTAG
jgi:hypothetical protein